MGRSTRHKVATHFPALFLDDLFISEVPSPSEIWLTLRWQSPCPWQSIAVPTRWCRTYESPAPWPADTEPDKTPKETANPPDSLSTGRDTEEWAFGWSDRGSRFRAVPRRPRTPRSCPKSRWARQLTPSKDRSVGKAAGPRS